MVFCFGQMARAVELVLRDGSTGVIAACSDPASPNCFTTPTGVVSSPSNPVLIRDPEAPLRAYCKLLVDGVQEGAQARCVPRKSGTDPFAWVTTGDPNGSHRLQGCAKHRDGWHCTQEVSVELCAP
jgi:hypothetical protein